MKIQNIAIEKIRPYDDNPRKFGEDAVSAIAESIKQFGWRQPIVVDRKGVIICGHVRYSAARLLGLTNVPVHVAKDLSPDKVRAYRIADNKTSELSDWAFAGLSKELGELGEGFDWGSLGFSDQELGMLIQTADISDEIQLNDLNEDTTDKHSQRSPTATVDIVYKVVVETKDESDQRKLIRVLENKGYKCVPLMS